MLPLSFKSPLDCGQASSGRLCTCSPGGASRSATHARQYGTNGDERRARLDVLVAHGRKRSKQGLDSLQQLLPEDAQQPSSSSNPKVAPLLPAGVTWDFEAEADGSNVDDGWAVLDGVDDADGEGEIIDDVELFSLEGGWSLETSLREVDGTSVQVSPGLAHLDDAQQDDKGNRRPLSSYPAFKGLPPHVLAVLTAAQAEAEKANAAVAPAELRKAAAKRKTHMKLSIIGGVAAGRLLRSPQGPQTRPMMEKVRAAVFSMIQAELGGVSCLPADARWLDLFAGTGAVGLEAVSRGCRQAHFVEMDSWVADKCLKPNLDACSLASKSVVHVTKAEDFLRRARTAARFAGGPFDFISVCPPYELVSYEELYDLLDDSPLLSDTTIIIVEYPKQLAHLVRETVGPLVKIRDRKYGRTYVAMYGPAEARDEDLHGRW